MKEVTAGKVGLRDVVGKIRFPLMGEEYLRNQVVGMVGEEDGEWMAGVVAEVLLANAELLEGAVLELEVLDSWGGRRWWIARG